MSDDFARASEALGRVREQRAGPRRPQQPRRRGSARRRLGYIVTVNVLILGLAIAAGLVTPLGLFGAMGVLVLMLAATLLIGLTPAGREPPPPAPEQLRAADLRTLPAQTTRWLDAQRPLLPSPAVQVVDRIGLRLDTLSPQLAAVTDDSPVAADIRKLVGEQLPDFIRDYAKVPATLRTVPRNGQTPDAQLVDGLKLIDAEIGEMTARLAQGDLDSLATRGRFLQIKYRGDESGT